MGVDRGNPRLPPELIDKMTAFRYDRASREGSSDPRPALTTTPHVGAWRAMAESDPTTPPATDATFDAAKFYLGRLCKRGHDWNLTGMTLRNISKSECLVCLGERKKKWAQTPEGKVKQAIANKRRMQDPAVKARAYEWKRKRRKDPVLHARDLEVRRKYERNPEIKARKNEYMRRHMEKPGVKARIAESMWRRWRDPAFRDRVRKYRQTEKIKNRERELARKRLQDPAYKARLVEKQRTPEARAYHAKWQRERRKNPSFRLRCALSSSVRNALKFGKQGHKWESIVGYTLVELTTHLEAQFTHGMTWENYGRFWHVDHIVPISAFSFSGIDDPEIRRAWALSNLRPLEATENWRKSNRLVLRSEPKPKRPRKR